MEKPTLTVRIQDAPEPAVEGNRFLAKPFAATSIHYVIVLADGVPVAQQSFFYRGNRWWVDNLFVAPAHRGTDVIRLLREATFRGVAERTDEFRAVIEYAVATPDKVLNDPIKLSCGLKIQVLRELRSAAYYRYDVSALRPKLAATG
jgi:hypothetical protein